MYKLCGRFNFNMYVFMTNLIEGLKKSIKVSEYYFFSSSNNLFIVKSKQLTCSVIPWFSCKRIINMESVLKLLKLY